MSTCILFSVAQIQVTLNTQNNSANIGFIRKGFKTLSNSLRQDPRVHIFSVIKRGQSPSLPLLQRFTPQLKRTSNPFLRYLIKIMKYSPRPFYMSALFWNRTKTNMQSNTTERKKAATPPFVVSV